MDLAKLISWMFAFPILGALGDIFCFCPNSDLYNILKANSGDPDQKPHSAASSLSLHCLPMSHEKDAVFGFSTCTGHVVKIYCRANQRWQWRNIVFTIVY